MLNLHAPFRRASPEDAEAITRLSPAGAAPSGNEAVVAEEDGRITAFLSGRPDGEAWRIERLVVAPERAAELGRRILAVADALAAEEAAASVTLDPSALAPELRAILDEEGFRPGDAAPGSRSILARPVVPQG
jgi:hypothetical protein